MTDEKKENLLSQISAKSGIDKKEIEKKIIQKQEDLDNIVSFEGAAYLVAEALNVPFEDSDEKIIKIKDIEKTMTEFTLYGKIIQMFDINEFQTSRGSGKVQNLIIADETGNIAVSLWNEVIGSFNIKIGDIVKIQNSRIRENNFGNLEIRCSNTYNIAVDNSKTINIDESKINAFSGTQTNETEGDYYLISLKKKPIIYYLCPVCRKKITDGVCQSHGKVEGNLFLVLGGIIDNGIERMDAVFFNTMVYDILGTKDLEKIEQIEHLPNYMNLSCIGNFYHIRGNIKENNFTKENEMTVRKLELVDVGKKAKQLEKEFGGFENAGV